MVVLPRGLLPSIALLRIPMGSVKARVISRGNTRDPNAWAGYPDSLSTNLVPPTLARVWNTITVSAFKQDRPRKVILP